MCSLVGLALCGRPCRGIRPNAAGIAGMGIVVASRDLLGPWELGVTYHARCVSLLTVMVISDGHRL